MMNGKEPMFWEEFRRIPSENILDEINYNRGVIMGQELRIKELEEQLKLAFEYQRAMDVKLLHEQNVHAAARLLERQPLSE